MTVSRAPGPVKIVLVDDDEDDRYLMGRAFGVVTRPCELRAVASGEALLELLGTDPPAALKRRQYQPDLILLDLRMPGMDGRQTLSAVKSDPAVRAVPVIMLTSSLSASDVAQCYDLGASAFQVKPPSYAALVDAMQRMVEYWTEVATLPDHFLHQA